MVSQGDVLAFEDTDSTRHWLSFRDGSMVNRFSLTFRSTRTGEVQTEESDVVSQQEIERVQRIEAIGTRTMEVDDARPRFLALRGSIEAALEFEAEGVGDLVVLSLEGLVAHSEGGGP